MPRTRVKICGITRPEDALLAAELGADAIGLNFIGGPRQLNLLSGRSIINAVAEIPFPPVFVALCGFPQDNSPGSLTAGEVGHHLRVNRFQVYGKMQTAVLCHEDSEPYWIVCPVSTREAIPNLVVKLHLEVLRPQAIVLDAASPEKLGGTGQAFNWRWIAEARAAGELDGLPPIILAGGLTPDNVAEAIRIARPWAVDVSSGVEIAGKPGIKDPAKMRDFVQAAQGA